MEQRSLFYFLLSQQSQHTSVWYTRATKQTPPIWRRMFNVEKVKRRKVILKKIITLWRVKCLNVPSLKALMSDSWFLWEFLWVRLGVDGIFISNFYFTFSRSLKTKVISEFCRIDYSFWYNRSLGSNLDQLWVTNVHSCSGFEFEFELIQNE